MMVGGLLAAYCVGNGVFEFTILGGW